jgi:hypothetical protein
MDHKEELIANGSLLNNMRRWTRTRYQPMRCGQRNRPQRHTLYLTAKPVPSQIRRCRDRSRLITRQENVVLVCLVEARSRQFREFFRRIAGFCVRLKSVMTLVFAGSGACRAHLSQGGKEGVNSSLFKGINMAIDIRISEEDRKLIVDGLSRLLSDTYVLCLKIHNFH